MNQKIYYPWLSHFSKFTVFSTLLLIFIGALVKSHEVGLSVPDWPTTYGENMFAFPLSDMVGGIFYEHGHRLMATFVGFLTLCQTIWLSITKVDRWLKTIGFISLCAVIIQGLFGGLTVIFYLPTIVSIIHGTLAQTFFAILIIISYSLSKERFYRNDKVKISSQIYNRALIIGLIIYLQLILGALVRHTSSGLAIPDFPTMGGTLLPFFNDSMLNFVNNHLFEMDRDMVSIHQVVIHFFHRLGALILSLIFLVFFFKYRNQFKYNKTINFSLWSILITILFQIFLGAATVLSERNEIITSLHVLNGALLLGLTVLLVLRLSPLKYSNWRALQVFK